MPSAGTMSLYNAVSLANSYILENHAEDNMFATLFFGMLNPDTGQLMYINAGHNPPHIVGADGTLKASLHNTGAAVGMFPNIDYKIEEAMLEPGDVLYTYTDGVTEARNVAGEFLTDPGLLELLDAPGDLRPRPSWTRFRPIWTGSCTAQCRPTTSPCWLCAASHRKPPRESAVAPSSRG